MDVSETERYARCKMKHSKLLTFWNNGKEDEIVEE
jgi:hypothetical protein